MSNIKQALMNGKFIGSKLLFIKVLNIIYVSIYCVKFILSSNYLILKSKIVSSFKPESSNLASFEHFTKSDYYCFSSSL